MTEMAERQMLVSDEDCHWYCIPVRLAKLFDELENKEDDCDSFNETFEEYRLNMHPSCYSFVDFKEIE
jgi:hypothetical protein